MSEYAWRVEERGGEVKHDLLWFEEYAGNVDVLKPLTPQEWKELAALLHEVNNVQGQAAKQAEQGKGAG